MYQLPNGDTGSWYVLCHYEDSSGEEMSQWQPPQDDARSAKANAKAAKARAKALRPWYLKKRWWLTGVVVITVIAAVAGSSGSQESSSTSSGSPSGQTESPSGQGEPEGQPSTSNGIDQGIGSQDATDDLVNLDCGAPDSIGITYPKVTVKNNSSKPSDYFITVVAQSADGSVKYDDTTIFISALQPGQQQTEEGLFTAEFPSGTICKVTEFQRTAS